jgi:hypothetical protein
MNEWVDPPPKRGMGCFAKGCLILIAFGILLIVAGIGGTFWGLRHIYLSDKPAPIPEISMANETGVAPPEQQPSVAAPSETSVTVHERLDTLKSAARAHQQTGTEFTAGDINALIAANPKSRGTAFVRIDGNVGQVQFSIPLDKFDVPYRNAFGLGDRYLNATVSIVAPPGTNADTVQLSQVTINGHSFPTDLLDRRLLGVGRSLRDYIRKYAAQYGVTGGEISDGKVILHTSGQ